MSRLNFGPRGQAVLVLALVAALGALLGIAADRLMAARAPDGVSAVRPGPGPRADAGPRFRGGPADSLWRWEARPELRYGDRLAGLLELSAEQRAQIDSIVDEEQERVRELSAEVEPRFRAIAEQTRSRVEQVLTPAQRERLRELRAERRRLGPAGFGAPPLGPGRGGR